MSAPLESRSLLPDGVPGAITPAFLRWLLEAGADELTITVLAFAGESAELADGFEDALEPYALPLARRRVMVDADGPGSTREVRRWRFSAASLAAFLPFVSRGLFHCAPGPAGWLEDLVIYRDGELMLGVLSNQQEGTLRLSADEHAAVARLGVRATAAGEWVGY